MVDAWEIHAGDNEINLHVEIFNNFHPIVMSQGKVNTHPSVAWPVARVEMLGLSLLTSDSESRRVYSRKMSQESGSWLTAVDRVVVADVATDNFPAVMLVLENPFSTKFRDLEGHDFIHDRNELLKKWFSWPSAEVSYHSSLVSYPAERLEEIAKWLELLG